VRYKEKYRLSSFGRVNDHLQNTAENAASIYWKLETIDSIKKSNRLFSGYRLYDDYRYFIRITKSETFFLRNKNKHRISKDGSLIIKNIEDISHYKLIFPPNVNIGNKLTKWS